jgi:hypothetical protein
MGDEARDQLGRAVYRLTHLSWMCICCKLLL